ncbi:hypothetical protein NPX13_g2881 [Xylaria arbuscula]|uniref:Ubiquitin-like domain-containing protein n=1 Tax=Xylaria arbuscula TaxID=114810 RepID=A0A9W8TPY0_9PEZI|nr:hypothetical protein NPX13_g2881 [Xylaria arbuscula]
MSFGFAIGDVIAVLGLFERVAIELRSYKNAPAHFQQLGVELELLHSTLRHVLCLSPEDVAEAKTLEQIRAIVMHCLPPIQALINRMRSKESTLGHYRSTRSLSNIGSRLHWSMVAQKDVEGLRTTLLSEMVAINMLLSAQQLHHIRNLSTKCLNSKSVQSASVTENSSALVEKTSKILDILSTTPNAITELRSIATKQAEEQSKKLGIVDQSLAAVTAHLNVLSRNVDGGSGLLHRQIVSMRCASDAIFSVLQNMKKLLILLATCSKEMLDAIGLNTRALLDIANQMKRIVRAIEAIPLHLTLDIVRLDDALGESWALPLQACTTWASFRNLLLNVVYANSRPGASRIENNLFVINLAKTGQVLPQNNWTRIVESGLHIEQAMIMPKDARGDTTPPARNNDSGEKESCPYPDCRGLIPKYPVSEIMKQCSTCERWSQVSRSSPPLLKLYDPIIEGSDPSEPSTLHITTGPRLPSLESGEDINCFRRVQINEPVEAVRDLEDARRRLAANHRDPEANAYIGLQLVQDALNDACNSDTLDRSIKYIEIAIAFYSAVGHYWYLLGRVHLLLCNYRGAFEALQQAVHRDGRCPSFWITAGIMYYNIRQYRDSLDALAIAVRLSTMLYVPWYNLGVLYDAAGQYVDAKDSYKKCLELNPNIPEVQARYQVLLSYTGDSQESPQGSEIKSMIDIAIRSSVDEVPGDIDADININPIGDVNRPDSHVNMFNQLVLDEDPIGGSRVLRMRKTSSAETEEDVIPED